MSLGKLLTAGKSLVGLHDSNARYRLQKGALPKFESSKNPFAARPPAGAPPAEADSEPELPKMTPAEMKAAKMKNTQALPVLAAEPKASPELAKPAQNVTPVETTPVETVKAPEVVQAAEAVKPPEVVEGWVKKLNPLVWFSGRKPAEPKPSAPRGGKRHVQGELSLDNIKVMRNDLSDTDVEVVPAKTRAPKNPPVEIQASGSAAAMAVPELPPATSAWEYLGERLLGKH